MKRIPVFHPQPSSHLCFRVFSFPPYYRANTRMSDADICIEICGKSKCTEAKQSTIFLVHMLTALPPTGLISACFSVSQSHLCYSRFSMLNMWILRVQITAAAAAGLPLKRMGPFHRATRKAVSRLPPMRNLHLQYKCRP